MVKKPFFWLCRAVINPIFAILYLGYRFFKKLILALSEPMRDRAMSLLANRYAIHAVVIVLTFAVTATNIYASNGASAQVDAASQKSILADLTQNDGETIVVEEATTESVNASTDVSYLSNQALTAHDGSAAVDDQQGTEEGPYQDDPDELVLSPLANAVRVEPQVDEGSAPPTRTRTEEYTVADGDTLGSIAREFGLRTETLLAANGLSARSVIRPGQILKILPVDGIVYKIKKGDTLSKIAKTFDSDAEKNFEMNGLSDGAALAVGDELVLPDGRLPAPPPPKQPSRIATNIKNIFVPPPSPDRTNGSGMIWPTAAWRITQYYGHWRAGARHTGVDIAGPKGTAVYAANDGVVAVSGWNSGGYGNMIIIDHGGGLFTRYGHASKLLVRAGDTVKRGDAIMLIGSTGRSTGPHLHFEVMTGDPHHRVNPLEYVKL